MALSLKHITGFLLTLVAVSIVASCNNNKAKEQKTAPVSVGAKSLAGDDSLQLVHDIDSADYLSMFKNKTNSWISKVLNDPQVKWTDFHLVEFWKDDSIKARNDTPGRKFLNDYAMFLKWSPDSLHILDFGSYSVTIITDKNGQRFIQDGEVDSEIRLYSNKQKTSARLLFHGPGTVTWDAHWLDSAQVALIGTSSVSNNHPPDTLLWIINIKDNFFRRYKYAKQ